MDKFSKKLCGKFRGRHFKGVINVVNRFIEIIQPHLIFLGFKDFQQLTLIKLHIKKNKIKTQVVVCPTIREKNGIALSSRNAKLKKNQIETAGRIYKYLNTIKKKKIFFINSKRKKLIIINKITLLGAKKIDYLECLNIKTLKSIKTTNENYNIFIAYYLGNVRLIDNL